jgi:hypothetical protein
MWLLELNIIPVVTFPKNLGVRVGITQNIKAQIFVGGIKYSQSGF